MLPTIARLDVIAAIQMQLATRMPLDQVSRETAGYGDKPIAELYEILSYNTPSSPRPPISERDERVLRMVAGFLDE